MRQSLAIAQIIVSLLLVILVLMQSQSGGLGATWGGGGGGETYHTRKGVEKVIFITTIIGIILFILISITNLIF